MSHLYVLAEFSFLGKLSKTTRGMDIFFKQPQTNNFTFLAFFEESFLLLSSQFQA